MPKYVDGFVIPVSKKKMDEYVRIARIAKKIWMEHGALEYRECVGDDLKIKGLLGFPKGIGAKPSETVMFSWITYKSRAHRDRVNKKVMADPRMEKMMKDTTMPFDCQRMLYGGFKAIVDA